MAASQAIKTQNTLIQVSDGIAGTSPIVWLTIGDVQTISGPGGDATEIDVTHLQSTAKEYLVGLKDEGEVTIAGSFVETNTGQRELRTARDAQEKRDFRITLSDNVKLDFQAFVRSFTLDIQPDDKVSFSATLRLSGAVTYTPA